MRFGGEAIRFEVLYSALGLRYRTGLARDLGAEHDAAGDIVCGLAQIVVAMGHAAIAATHIHNRRDLPTEEE